MDNELDFQKISSLSSLLRDYQINYAIIPFIISKHQFYQMRKTVTLFIKLLKRLYKNQEYYNLDLQFIKEIQEFSIPQITFSPMRFDFLLSSSNNLILSDINLPGSFVPDIFWPVYGLKEKQGQISFFDERFKVYNAFQLYHEEISKYLKKDFEIIRCLEKNSNKSEKQKQFLTLIYEYINQLSPIRLKFMNKSIENINFFEFSPNIVASIFLNTHNSPNNLLESIKILLNLKKPIFVNPKLLPYSDKRPPSLEFVRSHLKENEADYLMCHLPKSENSKNYIIKKRFGHSSSSFGEKLGKDIKLYPYPEVKIEKLNALSSQRIMDKNVNEYQKYKNYLFEISLNTFIITKRNSFEHVEPCVSMSSRGALSHPISGPHTLLFPTLVEV